MAGIDLPTPQVVTGWSALAAELASGVDGEVRFDVGSRAAYAVDASNYRQVPIGVVVPRTIDAGVAAIAICRRHRAPILSRGGGTSLAGQCANEGVVIDWSKYCTRIVSVDASARTCVVEPGVKLDVLNDALPDGLVYGPKPATHLSCTIGGMVGNNSCGSTAQVFGKVSDNVRRLEVLTYDGLRMWVGPTTDAEFAEIQRAGGRRAEIYAELRRLAERSAELVRQRYPDIPRRVSGYNLDALLPGGDFDVATALVGSESTLVTVLHAELDLVTEPPQSSLVVLGYPDVVAAARAVPAIAAHRPHQLEGIDRVVVDFQRAKGMHPHALHELPAGTAWLMVQFRDEDAGQARRKADALITELARTETAPTSAAVTNARQAAELWLVRESALAASARDPVTGRDNYEGWEDAAVAPERLGDYLADWVALLDEYGFRETTSIYGHFGHGCIHTRIPFDLRSAEGVATYRQFMERSADLVVAHGGSLSGEHGDGQSRGELLERMFGPELVAEFRAMKTIFDPDSMMNPGKVVDAYPLDENLRLGADYAPVDPPTAFSFPADGGSFHAAALRCVGVGRCRRESGGVMCPSYRVTQEEQHSTRGRARLLWEMLHGKQDSPVHDGWRSGAVREALDLCLSCKGCKSDCPVNVDMATYKAEFLYHHYRGRLRPAAHYSMGWLPALARLAAPMAPVLNKAAAAPGVSRVLKRAAGVDPRRALPRFAKPRFSHWLRARGAQGSGARGEVLLWPDTFTEFFHPWVGAAATRVLEDAGFTVRLPRDFGAGELCCGLTWISTGQLDIAKRVLWRTVRALDRPARAGVPIVGLEPSCTAVFRDDAPALLPGAQTARIAEATRSLGQLLRDVDWRPGALTGSSTIIQQHCHQHATATYADELAVLSGLGVDAELLDSGCCGLAGNFGFERGHYEVSVACGEQVLLPRVRAAEADTVVLADGFSCRTQIEQHSERTGRHLAELLATALPAEPLPW